MGLGDERARAQQAAKYERRVQACRICGRWFTRRKDDICSRACLEKAEIAARPESPSGA
jgi:hypothetical protein